jgi:hypothetical protein
MAGMEYFAPTLVLHDEKARAQTAAAFLLVVVVALTGGITRRIQLASLSNLNAGFAAKI